MRCSCIILIISYLGSVLTQRVMYDIFLLHFLHFVHLGNPEDNTSLFRIMCVQPTIQIFRFLLVGRLGWILIFFETWVL